MNANFKHLLILGSLIAAAVWLAVEAMIQAAKLPANFWSLPLADKWTEIKTLFAQQPTKSPFE